MGLKKFKIRSSAPAGQIPLGRNITIEDEDGKNVTSYFQDLVIEIGRGPLVCKARMLVDLDLGDLTIERVDEPVREPRPL